MRNINKREEDVLSSLIDAFVDTGRPVGSKSLSANMGNAFSSATIRKVMGELEKVGLLTQLHTSGGRIPTEKGIRYYVDKLLKFEPLSETKVRSIKEEYREDSYNISDVLQQTSTVLSRFSSYAGLVVSPMTSDITIKHLEFIQLSSERILGIFVGRDGLVENRIIRVSDSYNYCELEKINNYCNRAFYGLTLVEAKSKAEKELKNLEKECDDIISGALRMSEIIFLDLEKTQIFVGGGANLLNQSDTPDVGKIASLIDVLEEKKKLICLLKRSLESDNVNIYIGSESGYGEFEDCSIVSSSYKSKQHNNVIGTLGVIGPMKMNYSKVIPIVDCTAKLITSFLDGDDIYERKRG